MGEIKIKKEFHKEMQINDVTNPVSGVSVQHDYKRYEGFMCDVIKNGPFNVQS